jgi:hypothetical protein
MSFAMGQGTTRVFHHRVTRWQPRFGNTLSLDVRDRRRPATRKPDLLLAQLVLPTVVHETPDYADLKHRISLLLSTVTVSL